MEMIGKKIISNKMTEMQYEKVCVTDLVKHIHETTKAAYKDAKYETTYIWSHDALSQLFDSTCITWMKEQGYYDWWLKPEIDISKEVFWQIEEGVLQVSKQYDGQPVDNSPELMPLDNILFEIFEHH